MDLSLANSREIVNMIYIKLSKKEIVDVVSTKDFLIDFPKRLTIDTYSDYLYICDLINSDLEQRLEYEILNTSFI